MNAKLRSRLAKLLFGFAVIAGLAACASVPDGNSYDSHDSFADIYHGGDSDH